MTDMNTWAMAMRYDTESGEWAQAVPGGGAPTDYERLRDEIVRCAAAERDRDALKGALDAGTKRGKAAISKLLKMRKICDAMLESKKRSRLDEQELSETIDSALRLWDSEAVRDLQEESR